MWVVSLRSCMPIKKKKGANNSLWAKVVRFIREVKQRTEVSRCMIWICQ
jgi:hypothetical protein